VSLFFKKKDANVFFVVSSWTRDRLYWTVAFACLDTCSVCERERLWLDLGLGGRSTVVLGDPRWYSPMLRGSVRSHERISHSKIFYMHCLTNNRASGDLAELLEHVYRIPKNNRMSKI
jgi:hypothetical protein